MFFSKAGALRELILVSLPTTLMATVLAGWPMAALGDGIAEMVSVQTVQALPSNLPSNESPYCQGDVNDDLCWKVSGADINGDGRIDLLLQWYYQGNYPDYSADKLEVYLNIGTGYRKVIDYAGGYGWADRELFIAGRNDCRDIVMREGSGDSKGTRLIWRCQNGEYPNSHKPETVARSSIDKAKLSTCIECCSAVPYDLSDSCDGYPAIRNCRPQYGVSRNERELSEMARKAVEGACPIKKRVALCIPLCKKHAR